MQKRVSFILNRRAAKKPIGNQSAGAAGHLQRAAQSVVRCRIPAKCGIANLVQPLAPNTPAVRLFREIVFFAGLTAIWSKCSAGTPHCRALGTALSRIAYPPAGPVNARFAIGIA